MFKHYDPTELEPRSPLLGVSMSCDDTDVLEKKITVNVYRGDMVAEAGIKTAALTVNERILLLALLANWFVVSQNKDSERRWHR